MSKLKINLVIGGRTYPLSVKNTVEEEAMRKAAANINALIARYEQSYAVNDKQDVLAMCALQFAAKLQLEEITQDYSNEEALKRLNELTQKVSVHLE